MNLKKTILAEESTQKIFEYARAFVLGWLNIHILSLLVRVVYVLLSGECVSAEAQKYKSESRIVGREGF